VAKAFDPLANPGEPEPKQETAKARGTHGTPADSLPFSLPQSCAPERKRQSPSSIKEEEPPKIPDAPKGRKMKDLDTDSQVLAPTGTDGKGLRVQGLEPWTHGLKGRCSTY
jgi:hypothetical protein